MPKPLIHPHLRSPVMQIVLWMLLAAVAGLAMLVTRQRRLAMRAELNPPMIYNRLEVRLPRNWTTRSGSDGGDYIVASEVQPGQPATRELRVYRQRSGGLISPMEHLLRKGFLSPRDLASSGGRIEIEELKIADWPGVLVTRSHGARGEEAQILACAVLPNSQALVIELEVSNPNGPDSLDGDLVRQIAADTGIVEQPAPPENGGSAPLSDNISISVPSRFVLLPNADPNLNARQLLATEGNWVAVDLIPCLFFDGDDANTLRTMLMAHEPNWRAGVPEKLPGRRGLRCDRDEGTDNPFPSRAYLLRGDDEQAVLAIFRGGLHESDFDSAYQSIAASLHFTARHDIAGMLQAGSAESQRLRSEGLDKWLAASGSEQWSAWTETENAAPRPFLSFDWQRLPSGDGFVWSGVRHTFPLDPYGSAQHLKVDWKCSGDVAHYSSEIWASPESGNSLPTELRMKLAVEGEAMQMQTPSGSPAGSVLPGQFFPGSVLPLVIGKLSDKPMILRTESAVDCEGIAPPSLLTVVTLPPGDAPVKQDEKGNALRCVSLTVNGSGRISRWYFTENAELRYITLTGGQTAGESRE